MLKEHLVIKELVSIIERDHTRGIIRHEIFDYVKSLFCWEKLQVDIGIESFNEKYRQFILSRIREKLNTIEKRKRDFAIKRSCIKGSIGVIRKYLISPDMEYVERLKFSPKLTEKELETLYVFIFDISLASEKESIEEDRKFKCLHCGNYMLTFPVPGLIISDGEAKNVLCEKCRYSRRVYFGYGGGRYPPYPIPSIKAEQRSNPPLTLMG